MSYSVQTSCGHFERVATSPTASPSENVCSLCEARMQNFLAVMSKHLATWVRLVDEEDSTFEGDETILRHRFQTPGTLIEENAQELRSRANWVYDWDPVMRDLSKYVSVELEKLGQKIAEFAKRPRRGVDGGKTLAGKVVRYIAELESDLDELATEDCNMVLRKIRD